MPQEPKEFRVPFREVPSTATVGELTKAGSRMSQPVVEWLKSRAIQIVRAGMPKGPLGVVDYVSTHQMADAFAQALNEWFVEVDRLAERLLEVDRLAERLLAEHNPGPGIHVQRHSDDHFGDGK